MKIDLFTKPPVDRPAVPAGQSVSRGDAHASGVASFDQLIDQLKRSTESGTKQRADIDADTPSKSNDASREASAQAVDTDEPVTANDERSAESRSQNADHPDTGMRKEDAAADDVNESVAAVAAPPGDADRGTQFGDSRAGAGAARSTVEGRSDVKPLATTTATATTPSTTPSTVNTSVTEPHGAATTTATANESATGTPNHPQPKVSDETSGDSAAVAAIARTGDRPTATKQEPLAQPGNAPSTAADAEQAGVDASGILRNDTDGGDDSFTRDESFSSQEQARQAAESRAKDEPTAKLHASSPGATGTPPSAPAGVETASVGSAPTPGSTSITAPQQADASSGATGQATLSDVEAPRAVDQASRALRSVVNQRGGTVTLRLSPPTLGALRIEVDMSQQAVRAQFFTESAEARSLLQTHMGQLRSALESHGLQVEHMQVQTQNTPTPSNPNSGQNTGERNDGQSRGAFDQPGHPGQNPGDRRDDPTPQDRRSFQRELLDLVA